MRTFGTEGANKKKSTQPKAGANENFWDPLSKH